MWHLTKITLETRNKDRKISRDDRPLCVHFQRKGFTSEDGPNSKYKVFCSEIEGAELDRH